MRIITAAYAFAATSAILMAFSPGTLAAESALTNPGTIIEGLSAANVSEILTELGAQEVATREVNKTTIVDFKSAAVGFHLVLAACNARPGQCLAMIMLVGFDSGETSYPLETFNSFNRDNPFASAIKMEGSRFVVTRMLVSDGGITKKNIALNIASFASAPQVVEKHLASQVIAGVQHNGGRFQPASMAAPASPRHVSLSSSEILFIVGRQKMPGQTNLSVR